MNSRSERVAKRKCLQESQEANTPHSQIPLKPVKSEAVISTYRQRRALEFQQLLLELDKPLPCSSKTDKSPTCYRPQSRNKNIDPNYQMCRTEELRKLVLEIDQPLSSSYESDKSPQQYNQSGNKDAVVSHPEPARRVLLREATWCVVKNNCLNYQNDKSPQQHIQSPHEDMNSSPGTRKNVKERVRVREAASCIAKTTRKKSSIDYKKDELRGQCIQSVDKNMVSSSRTTKNVKEHVRLRETASCIAQTVRKKSSIDYKKDELPRQCIQSAEKNMSSSPATPKNVKKRVRVRETASCVVQTASKKSSVFKIEDFPREYIKPGTKDELCIPKLAKYVLLSEAIMYSVNKNKNINHLEANSSQQSIQSGQKDVVSNPGRTKKINEHMPLREQSKNKSKDVDLEDDSSSQNCIQSGHEYLVSTSGRTKNLKEHIPLREGSSCIPQSKNKCKNVDLEDNSPSQQCIPSSHEYLVSTSGKTKNLKEHIPLREGTSCILQSKNKSKDIYLKGDSSSQRCIQSGHKDVVSNRGRTKNLKKHISPREGTSCILQSKNKIKDIYLKGDSSSQQSVESRYKEMVSNPGRTKNLKSHVPLREATSCILQTDSKKNHVDFNYQKCLRKGKVVDINYQMRRAQEFKELLREIEQPLPSYTSSASHLPETRRKIIDPNYQKRRLEELRNLVLEIEQPPPSFCERDKSPMLTSSFEKDKSPTLSSSYERDKSPTPSSSYERDKSPHSDSQSSSTYNVYDSENMNIYDIIDNRKLTKEEQDIIEGHYQKRLSEKFEKLVLEDEQSLPSPSKRYLSIPASTSMWLLINPSPLEEDSLLKSLRTEPPMAVPVYDVGLPGFWSSSAEENKKLEPKP